MVVRYGDEAVQLVLLGVATSTVLLNGEEKEVVTAELEFGSTAEKEKQVAVIHAPKTGKCTLRAKASDSGKALQKCKAGTVVMVLEYGSKWCKISDNGDVGYVQTSCLKGYDAQTVGTGLLSYNGRTTGSTTINVRNTPSGDSAKVAEWKTGTKVEVFGLEKGWYEIEYNGIHGFVMEKFLTAE
ncbi:MAG: SH3 domain-containing protein [Clostridia bacterium]|nr:SH3 domain-containing protein [Clostridia bacterium]